MKALRDLEINALDRRTDGPQSDPIRVPFIPFEVPHPKNKTGMHYTRMCVNTTRNGEMN